MTHVSLNRHDVFTLRGLSAQEEPIPFPMILGNDGAGLLDDGTPVVIYPVMGTDSWRGDETIDPHWHIFSELVPGTMADYVAVPKRNAVPLPEGLSRHDRRPHAGQDRLHTMIAKTRPNKEEIHMKIGFIERRPDLRWPCPAGYSGRPCSLTLVTQVSILARAMRRRARP